MLALAAVLGTGGEGESRMGKGEKNNEWGHWMLLLLLWPARGDDRVIVPMGRTLKEGCGGSRRPDWTSKREGARLYGSTPRHRCEMGHWHAVAHWLPSPRWKGNTCALVAAGAHLMMFWCRYWCCLPRPWFLFLLLLLAPALFLMLLVRQARERTCPVSFCPVLITPSLSFPAGPALRLAHLVNDSVPSGPAFAAPKKPTRVSDWPGFMSNQVGRPGPASDDLESQRSFRRPSPAIPHPAQNLQRLQWLQAVSVGAACNGQGTVCAPVGSIIRSAGRSVLLRFAFPPRGDFVTVLPSVLQPCPSLTNSPPENSNEKRSEAKQSKAAGLRERGTGEEIAVEDEKYRTLHLPGHRASSQYKHMLRGLPPYLRKQRPPRDVDRHRSYHAMSSTLGRAQTTCSSAIIFYSRADAVRPVIHDSRRPSLAFSRLVGCVHSAVLCTIQTLYKTFSGNPSSRRVESQSRETVHNAMLSPLVGLQGIVLQDGYQGTATALGTQRPARPTRLQPAPVKVASLLCSKGFRDRGGWSLDFAALAPGTACLGAPHPRAQASNYLKIDVEIASNAWATALAELELEMLT
ncbi:hypothetical protein CSOJ01_03623 [Colletotrichum sojae]|uniref:Uncharacterized protein n=1 Tax=Colletotrichum sojae TaxID=2175907 RepID=A0A8H6JM82_9PEZI|nr:hypothetical protein CSOJ01_03623 [Colletotrichum sojae]